ncbi:MAG TPA: YjbQ family protein [Campylobacterales bacterium]|nr:YjbQ family protein [Campylobacterales bacterium]
MTLQKTISLTPKQRGFHLIDHEINRELKNEIASINIGTLNLFLQHTSASLALGENYEKEVRDDLESFFNDVVDEDKPYYTHTYEGKDDMPGHIKSIMIGVSLTIPITNGQLNLGTWQGIYLNEHRNRASGRTLVATVMGE